ncbi:beta-1,3-galactosyltransferase 2-like isoform X1 [Brachyistius frenatus]|uniref:beta-1,3-galactosyltransferase 2-like isoform X1 n=1 Tax=Brachyistius frenatus TaxID=100188 RepID=UPI0037E72457
MAENSVSKCEKTPRKRVRRWLGFLMLFFMMGTLIIYSLSSQLSWPLNFWRTSTWLSQSYDNMTTSVDSYFVAYPHQYHFILDEPKRCRQESPFLVLMIPVEPNNKEARDMIRDTWGKESKVLGQVVIHYFLLGTVRQEELLNKKQVLHESERHHDILQSDFLDSYNNLTIKTMVMFEWLSSHCPNTCYAMKIDSDMFLNVHNLVDMLLKAPRRHYMTGMVARSGAVLRDPNSKWFLPVSAFSESQYPPYALGLGYVFSLDLPKRILEASAHVKAVYIEDVYVGMCMNHLGIDLTDPPHGDLFMGTLPFFKGNCYWTSVITTILTNSKQLWDIWETYQTQIQSGC